MYNSSNSNVPGVLIKGTQSDYSWDDYDMHICVINFCCLSSFIYIWWAFKSVACLGTLTRMWKLPNCEIPSSMCVYKRPYNGKLQRTSLLSNTPNPRPTSEHLENWKKSAKIKQQRSALLNYPLKLYCVKQLKQKGKHDICRHTQSIPFGWFLNSKTTRKPQTVLASKEGKRFQTSALFTPQTDLGCGSIPPLHWN